MLSGLCVDNKVSEKRCYGHLKLSEIHNTVFLHLQVKQQRGRETVNWEEERLCSLWRCGIETESLCLGVFVTLGVSLHQGAALWWIMSRSPQWRFERHPSVHNFFPLWSEWYHIAINARSFCQPSFYYKSNLLLLCLVKSTLVSVCTYERHSNLSSASCPPGHILPPIAIHTLP